MGPKYRRPPSGTVPDSYRGLPPEAGPQTAASGAAQYNLSSSALRDDDQSPKIIKCGHFLAGMFGTGNFQDVVATDRLIT